MRAVNVTEFRNHLQKYLANVRKGNEILVTLHGNVIARILPPIQMKENAKNELKKLRSTCKIRDVVSPVGEHWEANK